MLRDELERSGACLSDAAALRSRTDAHKAPGGLRGLRGLRGPLDPAIVALRTLQGRSAPTSNLTLPAAANGWANLLRSSLRRSNPSLAMDAPGDLHWGQRGHQGGCQGGRQRARQGESVKEEGVTL